MSGKSNDKFLQSLKNRPDLAPREAFKQELKTKLFEEMEGQKISRPQWGRWIPNLLAAAFIMAGILFTVELIDFGKDGQNAEQQVDIVKQDPAPQEVTELSESLADKLIAVAFNRYDSILNDEGGETFTYKGETYRYMSEPFDSEEKVIGYLAESFTVDAARQMIKDHPFVVHNGKLAQPDVAYQSDDMWTNTLAVKVKTTDAMGDVTYEIPHAGNRDGVTVESFRVIFDHGWKFSVVMPFSHNEVEKSDDDGFSLTSEEKEAYQAFAEDPTEVHLHRLSPISIAKVYVQALLEGRPDLVYELYTDRREFVQWSKEEDENMNASHRATKEHILQTYKGIGSGEFIQTSDKTGYIKYDNGREGGGGFQMVKDEDGYWSVRFMPIQ